MNLDHVYGYILMYILQKSKDLEEELKRLHEEEAEKVMLEIKLAKEKNLRMDSYDKQVCFTSGI
jgi:hypothetical protein